MSQMYMTQYSSAVAVTPSDTTAVTCRGIYVGGTGTVVVSFNTDGSSPVTFTGVPTGAILPIALTGGRIMAATGATLLLALN